MGSQVRPGLDGPDPAALCYLRLFPSEWLEASGLRAELTSASLAKVLTQAFLRWEPWNIRKQKDDVLLPECLPPSEPVWGCL